MSDSMNRNVLEEMPLVTIKTLDGTVVVQEVRLVSMKDSRVNVLVPRGRRTQQLSEYSYPGQSVIVIYHEVWRIVD